MVNLKKIRVNKGLTQTNLAKSLGVTQQCVELWERNKRSPRAALLPKLAKVLGCTIDELMADGETEEAEENKGQIGREENAETERQ